MVEIDIMLVLINTVSDTLLGSIIGFIAFWVLLNFIFKEYEMDLKSHIMLSLQTFLVSSIVFNLLFASTWNYLLGVASSIIAALIVGDLLLVKSGLEKEEALKASAVWIGLWLALAVILRIAMGLPLII